MRKSLYRLEGTMLLNLPYVKSLHHHSRLSPLTSPARATMPPLLRLTAPMPPIPSPIRPVPSHHFCSCNGCIETPPHRTMNQPPPWPLDSPSRPYKMSQWPIILSMLPFGAACFSSPCSKHAATELQPTAATVHRRCPISDARQPVKPSVSIAL
jgi:hypothetical protein